MAEQMNKQAKQPEEQNLNDILRVRREKLASLQEAGEDPFEQTLSLIHI